MLSKSFGVDHLALNKGLYLSQVDCLEGTTTLTMDIRMRKPYVDPILTNMELHSLEHCLATGVREYTAGKEGILPIYIGPMGCATGFYLVLQLSDKVYKEEDYYAIAFNVLSGALSRVLKMDEIPAKDQRKCGNATTLGEVSIVHALAREVEEIVEKTKQANSFDEYTMIEEESE